VQGAQSKLYFIDSLIARLPSLRDRSLAPPDITYMSEQQLGVCLLRGIARAEHLAILDETALLVQRNPNTSSEIDFVGPLLQTHPHRVARLDDRRLTVYPSRSLTTAARSAREDGAAPSVW
jgi:hypothetical protein